VTSSLPQRCRAVGNYGSGNDRLVNLPTSVLLRNGHRIRMALAGADASLFERVPGEGTPKLTVYREAQRASYLDLPVKAHDP